MKPGSDGSVGRGINILGYLPEEDAYTYYGIGSRGRNETMRGNFEGSAERSASRGGDMRAGLTVLALILATPAPGGIEHTILHGVSVAEVRTWSGPATLPGLSRESLQAVAASRLHAAAIPLDPAAPAVLWISATVVRGDSRTCFVTLEAKLVEEARLERNGFLVNASSWRSAGFVTTGIGDCAEQVADAEERALADFVETIER